MVSITLAFASLNQVPEIATSVDVTNSGWSEPVDVPGYEELWWRLQNDQLRCASANNATLLTLIKV